MLCSAVVSLCLHMCLLPSQRAVQCVCVCILWLHNFKPYSKVRHFFAPTSSYNPNLTAKGGDGTAITPHPEKRKRVSSKIEQASLSTCIKVVKKNDPDLLYQLLKFNHKVLFTFCNDNKIKGKNRNLLVGTQWVLENNIEAWVSVAIP